MHVPQLWCLHATQAQRQEQQRAAQAAERTALLARMAEEDRVEQMSAQRRRMRVAEHQREVQRLLDARRTALDNQQVHCSPLHLIS